MEITSKRTSHRHSNDMDHAGSGSAEGTTCDCGSRRGAAHHHGTIPDTSGSRLLITLALNFLIPAVQVVGGIYANSIALISDAAHNFSDFMAVLIAYIANRIGKRGATEGFTFGYRRAEILAAALNVMLLFGVSVFLVYEAFHRILHPEPVMAGLVIMVAGVGILGNGISAWLLHKDSSHSLNVRGAFLHMLGDLFTSVAVAITGVVLIYLPWYWLDPALSTLIALFIIRNCWGIMKEAVCILMNGTPGGLNLRRIKEAIESIPGIKNAHYLHAWHLCSSSVAFSCHVVVPDQRLSQIEDLSRNVRHRLLEQFGIDHPVLQFETGKCGEGDMFCELSCRSGSVNNGAGKSGNEAV